MTRAGDTFAAFVSADQAGREALVADDARGTAAAIVDLGDACERHAAGQPGQALEIADALAALARNGGHGSAEARALRAGVPALAYLGRLDEAVARADDASTAARAAGDGVEAARAQVASMHALSKLGRTDEAISRGGEAAAQLERAGRPDLAARAELNLANVFKSRGDHPAALAALDRALAGVAESDRAARGTIENTRGETLLQLDLHDEAGEAFGRAAELLAELPFAQALVLGNLADLRARQGVLGEALRRFDEAADAMSGVAPGHHARLLLEKAEVLATLGAHGEALADVGAALDVATSRGLEAERARGLLVRARCLLATGDRDGARQAADAALEAARAMKDERGVRAAALVGADVALAGGEGSLAERLATLAGDERASPLERSRACIARARAKLFEGDAAEALRLATEAGALADELAVPTVGIDARCAMAAGARALGSTTDAIASLEAAVAASERLRGTLAAESHRGAFAASRLRAYEELALDLLASDDPDALDRAFATIERARSRLLLDTVLRAIDRSGDADAAGGDLARLRARLAALHAEGLRDAGEEGTRRGVSPERLQALRATEAAIDACIVRDHVRRGGLASLYAEPVPTPDLRRALAPDDLLVSYFACGDELLALTATREGIGRVRAVASMAEVELLVEKVLYRLRTAARRGEDARGARSTRALLGALHDAIVAPVLHATPAAAHARRLVLVPFGPLHALPFAALRDGDAWLVERFEIATAPSASLACLPPRDARGSASPMLVVGVADAHAPRISSEVDAIARTTRGDRLVGEDATIAAFRAAVRGRDSIHLACHGRFVPALPAASGIRLADGWLPVREIVALDLDADLVFLSACESGRHAVDAGEELCGIARSFLAAGARRVVTSLWSVRDEAAEAVATGYHTRSAAGSRPSTALRDAMLAAMRVLQHPADWASFNLTGGL